MRKQLRWTITDPTRPMLYLYPIDSVSLSPMTILNRISIGQSSSNHLQLPCSGVSKYHLCIEKSDKGFLARDLGSETGTYLNGTHINEAYLSEGDRLRIGHQEWLISFIHKDNHFQEENNTYLQSQNEVWNKSLQCLSRYSKKDLPILLQGESGVGKEVIARHIHDKSPRRHGLFVAVNCSSLKDSLIESELFGHIKGSFTGATSNRKGAFEAARRGTLFLDEIGDLDIHLQPKLLRAIENKEIRPVGSDSTIKTDVRIIAATHRDLPSLILQDKFRSDLFFRLNVIQIKIPALRERMEDFESILFKFAREMQVKFHQPVIQKIKGYHWPGNIRELKNFVARASVVCKDKVCVTDLPYLINSPLIRPPLSSSSTSLIDKLISEQLLSLDKLQNDSILREVEKIIITDALIKHKGHQTSTAKFLGVSRSTLHSRIQQHRINIDKKIEEIKSDMQNVQNENNILK